MIYVIILIIAAALTFWATRKDGPVVPGNPDAPADPKWPLDPDWELELPTIPTQP